ncbi:MAG: hypothetical protein JNJ48_05250 [Phycisphaerae bacterium]|nr:hypothetical protein [Phycisphaerae bacterium]
MVELTSLWMPILVSAVLVFFASSIIWMALPIHKKDYLPLGAAEGPVIEALRAAGLAGRSAQYMLPACDPHALKDPSAMERFKQGPWGVISISSKAPNMGSMLGLWMVNLVLVSLFVGYLASHACKPGEAYLSVFRIAGTAAFLAHGGNAMCDSIWRGRPWSHLPGALFDAVVYALLTAGAFAWLWPKAV